MLVSEVLGKGKSRAQVDARIRAKNLALVDRVLALRQRERSMSAGRSPLTILEAVQDTAWFGPASGSRAGTICDEIAF